MAYRGRESNYDDRDHYRPRRMSDSPPRQRSASRRRTYDDVDIQVRERQREVERTPAFLREDARRLEAGPLVLRQREIETVERPRRRSPSPGEYRERIVRRARSLTPPIVEHEHERIRTVDRERIRSPSRGPSQERVRSILLGGSRSPSPRRYRRRAHSLSSDEHEHEHEHVRTRIVERERRRASSSSSSPARDPPVVRAPTIEREVITHYRDIDHGVVVVRPPSVSPPRRKGKERDTSIDIYTSKHRTEVDIHRHSRNRSSSSTRRHKGYYDDDIHITRGNDRLAVHRSRSRRRAHSAAPSPLRDRDEAEYITSKIEARGRMGEAWHGATRDWTIVDVPPGTKRVRMDGAGGGGAEVTWQRYNGVRRARFIPERDAVPTAGRSVHAAPARDRLSVQVYDREKEIDIEKVTDRRVVLRPPPKPKPSDMWTEITKDLVNREAIQRMGYDYEETEFFFYIIEYLKYEEVLQLVQLTEDIRRHRRRRHHGIRLERDHYDDLDRHYHIHRRHKHHHHSPGRLHGRDGERVVEHEVVIDRPGRYY